MPRLTSLLAVIATGSLLAGCSDPYQHGAGVNTAASSVTTSTSPPASVAPASTSSGPSSTAPSSDLSPQAAAGPSTAEMQAARRAARRFVGPYVLYTYGQLKAQQIPAADPGVIAQLAAQPPSVPRTLRSRHPKVTSLSVSGGQPGQVTFQANVSDGVSVYSLPLTVTLARNHWLVTSVQ